MNAWIVLHLHKGEGTGTRMHQTDVGGAILMLFPKLPCSTVYVLVYTRFLVLSRVTEFVPRNEAVA